MLKRVFEIPTLRDHPSPFAVVAGASAGAISLSFDAAYTRTLVEIGCADAGEGSRIVPGYTGFTASLPPP